MSMANDGTALQFLYTNAVLAYNSAYTVCGWFKCTDASIRRGVFSVAFDGDNSDEFMTDYLTPQRVYVASSIGGAFTRGHGATVISDSTWYFWAMRRTAVTALDVRVNTSAETSVANDITGRTAADQIRLFVALEGTTIFSGSMAQVRIWTTNLTDGELDTEKASPTVVKSASLFANWPLANATDFADLSGNGYTLVLNSGSMTTDSDNPPQGGGGAGGLMWL